MLTLLPCSRACSFPLFESTNPGCTSLAVSEHNAVMPGLPGLRTSVHAAAQHHHVDGSPEFAASIGVVAGHVEHALAAHMSHLSSEEKALSVISAAVPHAAQVDVFVRAAAIQGEAGAAGKWLPVVLATLSPPHAAQYVLNYHVVAAAAAAPGIWGGLVSIVAAAVAAGAGGHGGLGAERIADMRERVPALDAALRAHAGGSA